MRHEERDAHKGRDTGREKEKETAGERKRVREGGGERLTGLRDLFVQFLNTAFSLIETNAFSHAYPI